MKKRPIEHIRFKPGVSNSLGFRGHIQPDQSNHNIIIFDIKSMFSAFVFMQSRPSF